MANNKGKNLKKKRKENGATLRVLVRNDHTQYALAFIRLHIIFVSYFTFTYLHTTYLPACLPIYLQKEEGKKTVSARSRAKQYNGFFSIYGSVYKKKTRVRVYSVRSESRARPSKTCSMSVRFS